jgi:DNA-binding transcriptional regulator LsrR (DeoR family)
MGAAYHRRMSPTAAQAPDLSTQVARLFFDRQLSKVEIASRLGISRFRVARLIDGALADGLVRIEYRDVPAEDRELAGAMEERFGLDLCAVAVATPPAGAPAANADVPRLAGAVLDGLIGDGDAIGIAWGSTLAAVVRAISPRRDGHASVVQLAGSSSRLDRDGDAGELARALADRLGGTAHPIFAPTFVETAALRTALLREPDLAGTVDRFGSLDLAIVGVGAMPVDTEGAASSLVRSGVLGADELAGLTARGAVGDLVVHPFDATGAFVAPELAARAVAIGIDDLRRTRRVVAVASGVRKAGAIRGALATGIVRILVTDAATARAVLGAG